MWNKTKYFKTCGACKKEFPKTEQYFFKRTCKSVLANGDIRYNAGFRSNCKECHSSIGYKKTVKKRCEELNCDVSEYRENWKKQYTETRTYFKEFIGFPLGTRMRMHEYKNEGKDVSSYEKYRHSVKLKLSKIRRKYDYGDVDFVPPKTQTGIINLTDGYIALTLGMKVKEVPKEIIETKRLIIQLKRELKLIK